MPKAPRRAVPRWVVRPSTLEHPMHLPRSSLFALCRPSDRREALRAGADPHGLDRRAAPPHRRLRLLLAVFALTVGTPGCDEVRGTKSAASAEDQRAAEELASAFTPLDPTLTSDKHDAALV